MNKCLYLLALVLICLSNVNAVDPSSEDSKNIIANELVMLDDLIQSTQRSLELQHKLRDSIQAYQEMQKKYLASDNQQDNELLFRMAKAARKILEMMTENQLSPLFDPAFLGELTLVSRPATKRGIPAP